MSETIREAARNKSALDGADAQALEHSLTQTEIELKQAREELRELREENQRMVERISKVLYAVHQRNFKALDEAWQAAVQTREQAISRLMRGEEEKRG